MTGRRETERIDKWLWHARFFKTRSLATAEVATGHIRLNGQKISKPAQSVGEGDTLTFPQGSRIRLIRVVSTGIRRGPAAEAQRLYVDLDAAEPDGTALE